MILEIPTIGIMIIGFLFLITRDYNQRKDFDRDSIGEYGFFTSFIIVEETWDMLKDFNIIARIILIIIIAPIAYYFTIFFTLGTLRWTFWLVIKKEIILKED